jgi:hypothetical protein
MIPPGLDRATHVPDLDASVLPTLEQPAVPVDSTESVGAPGHVGCGGAGVVARRTAGPVSTVAPPADARSPRFAYAIHTGRIIGRVSPRDRAEWRLARTGDLESDAVTWWTTPQFHA